MIHVTRHITKNTWWTYNSPTACWIVVVVVVFISVNADDDDDNDSHNNNTNIHQILNDINLYATVCAHLLRPLLSASSRQWSESLSNYSEYGRRHEKTAGASGKFILDFFHSFFFFGWLVDVSIHWPNVIYLFAGRTNAQTQSYYTEAMVVIRASSPDVSDARISSWITSSVRICWRLTCALRIAQRQPDSRNLNHPIEMLYFGNLLYTKGKMQIWNRAQIALFKGSLTSWQWQILQSSAKHRWLNNL